MKAYKGFNHHEDGTLWCRDFQYEVGKAYKFDDIPILCERGFHACHEPWQCWQFYPNNGENVYYEVECSGMIIESDKGDGKFICTEITLVKEIPVPENKFDNCWIFHNGYAVVRLDDKYNYIDTKGKYLSEQWFDYCGDFCNGYAIVRLNDKCNYINTKGQIISERWWDDCWDFCNGYAIVLFYGKQYIINKNGKIIIEK